MVVSIVVAGKTFFIFDDAFFQPECSKSGSWHVTGSWKTVPPGKKKIALSNDYNNVLVCTVPTCRSAALLALLLTLMEYPPMNAAWNMPWAKIQLVVRAARLYPT